MTQTFQAHSPDISCGGCANAIKRSLGTLPGVQVVDVDIPGKNITVQYDPSQIDVNALQARLGEVGYPVK